MNKFSILFTSAGRRVELINLWKETLSEIINNFEIISVDINPELSAACQKSDKYFKIVNSGEKDYIPNLLNIALQNNTKLIIPTIDNDLEILSKNRKLFLSNNIELLVSDYDFTLACNDKIKTEKLFKALSLRTPAILNKNNLIFPCFLKMKNGSSSKGTKKIVNKSFLSKNDIENNNNIFQELVPSDWREYSVDMYYSKDSKLISFIPRERLSTRDGEISKGITRKNEVYFFLKDKLKFLKGARGVITTQLFADKNLENFLFIEINPRFGGGYPMSHLAGANFPFLIIKEYLLGEKISYINDWSKDSLFLRYDSTFLVKF